MKSPEKEKVVNLKYEFKEDKVCAMILGKLICFFKGHKRGKRVDDNTSLDAYNMPTHQTSTCPRCGRVKKYKVKEVK